VACFTAAMHVKPRRMYKPDSAAIKAEIRGFAICYEDSAQCRRPREVTTSWHPGGTPSGQTRMLEIWQTGFKRARRG